jgi:Tfp pilus assembly protein PilV
MTRLRRAHEDSGMTLIETLVTIMVITGGLLVTLGVFSQMGRATYVAQRKTVLISMAQREMERLRVLPYDQIGQTSAMPASAPARCRDACPAERTVDGGLINPGGETFQVQGVTGTIYRYVTWRVQACPVLNATVATDLSNEWGQSQTEVQAAVGDLCPGTEQTKRITIVVSSSDVVKFTGPVRLSTVVADPKSSFLASGNSNGLQVDQTALINQANASSAPPDPYASLTTQSFNLTDTRCELSTRQAPGSGHVSHDTSGPGNSTCTGSSQADLMTTGAITGLVTDALPDLSQEVSRAAVGGRALARDDRAGACDQLSYTGSDTARRKRSVHSWASKSPGQTWETPDSGGRATLTFWSQVASAQELPGRLCVTAWRSGTGQVLGSIDYKLPAWPSEPTELAISFDLAHVVVPAGERLMLTLRTPSDSGSDLLLLYDHPGYQTSLAITTKMGKEIT